MSQGPREDYPEYTEYQRYYQLEANSDPSLYDGFETAQSAQHYLEAPAMLSSTSLGLGQQPDYDISRSDYFDISPLVNVNDQMTLHFMVQNSIADAKGFKLLSYKELDDSRKEADLLASRIADIQHKLDLEHKMRQAAASISRLGSTASTAPSSPQAQRRSFLFNNSGRDKKRLSRQAEDEIQVSNRKIESLQTQLPALTDRLTELNMRILKHHVALLALTHPGSESSTASAFAESSPSSNAHKATSRMLLHHRDPSSAVSPPQSPQNRPVGSQTTSAISPALSKRVDSLINRLSGSLSTQTSSPRQPSSEENLDYLCDLCERVASNLDNAVADSTSARGESQQLRDVVIEMMAYLDPNTQNSDALKYRTPSQLRSVALEALDTFQATLSQELNLAQTDLSYRDQKHEELKSRFAELQEKHAQVQAQAQAAAESVRSRATLEPPSKPSSTHSVDVDSIKNASRELAAELDDSSDSKGKALLRSHIDTLTQSYEANRLELERLELENVDLKTSLQESKFSSQAEAQQLKNQISSNEERVQEWKERCEALRGELESVVRSLEEVTRQAVDYESDRSKLEKKVQDLQNRLFQMSNSHLDQRVSMIATTSFMDDASSVSSSVNNSPSKRALPASIQSSPVRQGTRSGAVAAPVPEPVSVSMLRHEFRRITLEMNVNHMREVKRLQSENKKLEHLLKSIKTSSYMANLSPDIVKTLG